MANTPKPTDATQVKDGDKIVLLTGDYDPAHIDYARAAEALADHPGVTQVWLAPLDSRERSAHVMNMTTIMATDLTSATHRQFGCCLVGLGKKYLSPDELMRWCQNAYPGVLFQVARIDCNTSAEDIAVVFANEEAKITNAAEVVYLGEYLRQPSDLVAKIGSGRDMARSFLAPVWEYIQRFKLYR